jgi:putative phosphoesterase
MRLTQRHLRVGLISDTHIEHVDDDVPPEVYQHFAGVDLILHAGDIYIPQMLDRLERLAPLVVVAGNGEEDRKVQDPRLTDSRVLELGGLKIGLRHSIVFPEIPLRWSIELRRPGGRGGDRRHPRR